MRSITEDIFNWVKRHRIVNWISSHPIQFTFCLIIGFGGNLALSAHPSIPVDQEISGLITHIFQLIALILPALAILIQAILKFSEGKSMILAGKGPEIRRWSAAIVGFSSVLMAFVVIILTRLIILPIHLKVSLYLMALVIFGFALIPIYVASLGWVEGYDEAAIRWEIMGLMSELDPILDNSDEVLEELLEMHDQSQVVESNEEPPSSQSKLDEF